MRDVDLRELRRRIPIAGNRALAEIVDGLETAENLTAARVEHGFFSRVILGWNRKDRQRALESQAALALTQRRMVAWAQETARHLAFTDLTVGLLAMEVEQLQDSVLELREANRQAFREIRELAAVLAEFIDAVDRRFAEIDERLDGHERILDTHARALLELDRRVLATELWQSAWADGDLAVRRWRHQGAYAGLPWPCQVLLLARECATGRQGLHEFVTGDEGWRERLADDVLADPRAAAAAQAYWPARPAADPGPGTGPAVPAAPSYREVAESVRRARGPRPAPGGRTPADDPLPVPHRRQVRSLLERIIADMPDADERRMVAEVAGIGLSARLRPPHRPIGYAVARALDLSTRPPARRPEDPARVAVEDARRDCGHVPAVTQEEFVRGVVHEQADAARQARAALRTETEKRRGTGEGGGPDA
ncbi:hypothetical protein [Actinacidiphila glaucinigra]|uniref:hypothetical protein n=1 Tax=Actinacidiphila glaucinigra TaxID=235986 RepID=UPI0035D7D08D